MKVVLFDLDGTIVNTQKGITNCIRYALQHFQIQEEDENVLRAFIGPPLYDSFQKHYSFSDMDARKAVQLYRERYSPIGLFESELYPGVMEMLEQVKNMGCFLSIASSKPEEMCTRLLKHFRIADYFDDIVGATLDGRISTKTQVLESFFARHDDCKKEETCLVGDTLYDASGAKECGIPCIGVSYGFGQPKELKASGVLKLCEQTSEIPRALKEYWNERF